MNIQPWENTIGEIEKEKELDRADMSNIRREGGGHSRHVQDKKRGREGDQIVDQAWEILIPHVTIQRRRCYKKNTQYVFKWGSNNKKIVLLMKIEKYAISINTDMFYRHCP